MKTIYDQSNNGLARNIADIGRDIAELAELQVKLLASDSRDAMRHAIIPGVAIIIAISLLLGTIPVALLAGASALEVSYGITRPVALGIMSGLGLVVAAITAAVAWSKLRKSLMSLERSRSELTRNIDWLKHTLSREAERSDV